MNNSDAIAFYLADFHITLQPTPTPLSLRTA